MQINFRPFIHKPFINNTSVLSLHQQNSFISFKSTQAEKTDVFEKEAEKKTFNFSVYNPFTNSQCMDKVSVDLSVPQKIVLSKNSRLMYANTDYILDYDPERTDYLFDKIKNKRIKVVILESKDGENNTAYHFMSPNLKEEYGYVNFTDFCPEKDSSSMGYLDFEVKKDYKKYGIIGRRLIIDYLQNQNSDKIKGVGKLADKLTVKYCLDNNMKPVIVSNAEWGSHASHYLRGKRFLPLSKSTYAYEYFKNNYGTADVNKILKQLLSEAKKTGKEPVSIDEWGFVPMYMPEKLAKKYIEELKSEKK